MRHSAVPLKSKYLLVSIRQFDNTSSFKGYPLQSFSVSDGLRST